MAIRIITDSTSDITKEQAKELGINVVPLKVRIDNQEYLDGETITHSEFYEKLKKAKEFPTTSQPTPEQFLKCFEEAKQNQETVIAILISGKLSGTVQSAKIAKELSEYDDIYVIDSLNTITGLRLLVEYAVKLKDEGKSAIDIVNTIEEAKQRVVLNAFVNTLDYLHKGGRLSKASAVIGTILNIKPLIYLKDGKLGVCGKARGINAAMSQVVDSVKNSDEIDDSMPVYFGYTHIKDACLDFKKLAEDKYNLKETKMHSIGAIVGSHVGEGAAAIIYLHK